MNRPVVLRLEARTEFHEGFDWYERKRSGLGADFAMRVEETFDRIASNPERCAKVLHEVRRAPVRRFPYSVFYQVETEQLVVIAVFHSKRDPKIWQSRV